MFLAAYGFYIHFPVVLKQNKTKEQQTKSIIKVLLFLK